MTIRDRIAALVSVAPPDATVTVGWLGELLEAEDRASTSATQSEHRVAVEFTVAEVAARFRKGLSTVRTWLARDELPGAYRLHGREWRIPLAGVEAMQREQAKRHGRPASAVTQSSRVADLAAWRSHIVPLKE